MKSLFKLIAASYLHNKLRCALVVIALIVACAGLSAVLLINDAAKSSYASANQPFLTDVKQRIIARSGNILTKQDYAQLRRAGFNQLIPVLRSQHNVGDARQKTKQNILLLGIDTFAVLSYLASHNQSDTSQTETVPPNMSQLWQSPANSIIHPDFARQLGFVTGQVLTLDSGQILPRLALSDINGLGREIVLDLGQLQKVLGQSKISELLVVGALSAQTLSKLKSALPDHLNIESINTAEQANQLTESFHLNLLAMASLMFVVCMFVVMNALHLLFMRRWHNLRICRQLGVSLREIYLAHGVELVLLSVICAPIGALFGVFLAQLASPTMVQTLQNLFDVRVSFVDSSYYLLMMKSFIACLLGAICAAVLPLRQLNTKLAKLTTHNNTQQNTHGLKWLAASLIMGLMAIFVLVFAYQYKSMGSSFLGIALTIFAGCALLILIVPLLLTTLFKMMPTDWVLLRWTAADGVRLSQKSKIACCAFFIAVTSNVGMNLMVDSFRQATQQWLEQRLVADLYVSTSTPDSLTQWIATQAPDVQIYARLNMDAQLLDPAVATPIELRSYPSTALYQQALSFVQFNKDAWQQYNSGDGVFINQQLAIKYNLSLNQLLHFKVDQMQPDSRKIVGVYYDFGNQSPQAYLPASAFPQCCANSSLFALHFDSPQRQQAFVEKLMSSGTLKQVNSYTSQDLLAVSMRTFDRTFIITDGLNIVTLLVAALSLATSVLMIDMDNRPQRALMRSLGLGHVQIAGLSLLQYILLCALTCLVAIPFGIALTWLLINLINVQAFSWSYPLLINPEKLINICIISIAMVVIVVALPLYQLSKRKLIEDIKCIQF